MVAISSQVDIDIDIDSRQVLRNIGYGPGGKLPARMASLLNDYLENANHLLEPSYSSVVRDVKWVRDPVVVIDGPIIFRSHVIARLLEPCEKVAVFLVTIGDRLEEMVGQLSGDGLVLQAAVLDAIGSVAAESVAGFVQDAIGKIAGRQGLAISQRFSPGYCDWNIEQQKTVFQAVNGDSMGIRLTEGCLMLPRKSISGVIGIGTSHSGVEHYNPCRTCDRNNCPGRR